MGSPWMGRQVIIAQKNLYFAISLCLENYTRYGHSYKEMEKHKEGKGRKQKGGKNDEGDFLLCQ